MTGHAFGFSTLCFFSLSFFFTLSWLQPSALLSALHDGCILKTWLPMDGHSRSSRGGPGLVCSASPHRSRAKVPRSAKPRWLLNAPCSSTPLGFAQSPRAARLLIFPYTWDRLYESFVPPAVGELLRAPRITPGMAILRGPGRSPPGAVPGSHRSKFLPRMQMESKQGERRGREGGGRIWTSSGNGSSGRKGALMECHFCIENLPGFLERRPRFPKSTLPTAG